MATSINFFLPREMIQHISSYLPDGDRFTVFPRVCKAFRTASLESKEWNSVPKLIRSFLTHSVYKDQIKEISKLYADSPSLVGLLMKREILIYEKSAHFRFPCKISWQKNQSKLHTQGNLQSLVSNDFDLYWSKEGKILKEASPSAVKGWFQFYWVQRYFETLGTKFNRRITVGKEGQDCYFNCLGVSGHNITKDECKAHLQKVYFIQGLLYAESESIIEIVAQRNFNLLKDISLKIFEEGIHCPCNQFGLVRKFSASEVKDVPALSLKLINTTLKHQSLVWTDKELDQNTTFDTAFRWAVFTRTTHFLLEKHQINFISN